jgi:hypothetical protein
MCLGGIAKKGVGCTSVSGLFYTVYTGFHGFLKAKKTKEPVNSLNGLSHFLSEQEINLGGLCTAC